MPMLKLGERDWRVTALLDLDLVAEDLNCNLSFLYYPTNLEKFGELYETPLSDENPTNCNSYIRLYIYTYTQFISIV